MKNKFVIPGYDNYSFNGYYSFVIPFENWCHVGEFKAVPISDCHLVIPGLHIHESKALIFLLIYK